MTNANARPHRRDLLVWGRSIVMEPTNHSPAEIWNACEVLIQFGTLHDLAKVSALRAEIEAGAIKPWSTAATFRRWASIAALVAFAVWMLVWIIGAVADAQAAGCLPSILEMLQ